MKKIKFLVLAVLVCFGLQSCDKLAEVLSVNKTYNVHVTVDRSALPASVTNIKVQSFVQSVTPESNTFDLEVIDNNEPQLIAVTDMQDNLLMLYRGPMSENANITINAASTALALVTFNPLMGPVGNSEYPQLKNLVEGLNCYQTYATAVSNAVAEGTDLSTAINGTLKNPLSTVLSAACVRAEVGLRYVESRIDYTSNFAPTKPMLSSVRDSVITLCGAGNCPSYFGHVYNANNEAVSEVYVACPSRYPFMNYFNSNADNLLGVSTAVKFPAPGIYTVNVSCNDRSALIDLYARLITNTLATLGAEVDKDEIAVVAATVRGVIEDQNVEIEEANTDQVMNMIVSSYDNVINYMKTHGKITGNEGNWNLGSNVIRHLFANYKGVSEATDLMLRTSWNLSDDNFRQNGGVISFKVNYANDGAGNASLTLVNE